MLVQILVMLEDHLHQRNIDSGAVDSRSRLLRLRLVQCGSLWLAIGFQMVPIVKRTVLQQLGEYIQVKTKSRERHTALRSIDTGSCLCSAIVSWITWIYKRRFWWAGELLLLYWMLIWASNSWTHALLQLMLGSVLPLQEKQEGIPSLFPFM